MPDVEVGDQLVLALAEEGSIGHQRDFRRQLEVLQRPWPSSRPRATWRRSRPARRSRPTRSRTRCAPSARGRRLRLRMAATNSFTCGTFGWFQYHSKTQVPMRASGGRPSSTSSSCCAPARWNFLSRPNCTACLSAVDHVVARREEDDDVGVRRLRLDQVRREVGGAERGEVAADLGAAELGRGLLEARLQAYGRRHSRA